jgi:hypothetical protein
MGKNPGLAWRNLAAGAGEGNLGTIRASSWICGRAAGG